MKLARTTKRYVQKVERFARRRPYVFWGSVAGGSALLLYAVWPKSSVGSQQFGIHAPRSISSGTAPPKFLDEQLAGQKLVIQKAQAANKPALVAQATKVLGEIQAKIDYLNTPQGITDSLNALNRLLGTNYAAMTNGNVVIMNGDTFRRIYTHQGGKVLDLVSSVFYPKGVCAQFSGPCSLFSTDEIANHGHCQTIAAQVVQLGDGWMAPFYNSVYRYPSNNPNYAGNAIDPHTDPGAWETARAEAVEAYIKAAGMKVNFGEAMDNFNKVLFVTGAPPIGTLYTLPVTDLQKTRLAQLAIDMMAKNGKTPPGTDIPEPQRSMLLASIGAGIVAKLIDSFESHTSQENPCIRDLTPELVFQMFAATLGTVIGLAIGPALSGTAVALQIATTIQKLANLSK